MIAILESPIYWRKTIAFDENLLEENFISYTQKMGGKLI